jgi:hypothetical protein
LFWSFGERAVTKEGYAPRDISMHSEEVYIWPRLDSSLLATMTAAYPIVARSCFLPEII